MTYSKIKLGVLLYRVTSLTKNLEVVDYLVVADDVEEGDDVWSATKNLQDLNLPLDFLLLDWFEDFDDAFVVVGDVDSLKDFRVLAPSNLPHNLIIIRVSPRNL